ncbi:DEAD/DEAH box helicase [Erysipelothrix sp. HDW6C]|uniref:DEAD/DEAH box helicase n=1 Tax=Erysipelothrix sp. HDW6C TaxID=2714930 RepID=UPI00140750E3|nr:DEAD/DEAH box helicase [Erysipelothrix sp. HDW6C]QIK70160.1 DEAD/DEAH box helicase [Erysipelothrix sp. HDW6C]
MNLLNKKLFEKNNFKELTSVQSKVLKEISKKRDLIVKSDTGTGKTHAFLFAILELIDPNLVQTQAIILAPTRELAMQIFEFSKDIMEIEPLISIDLAIGGMDNTRLNGKVSKQPHILISTPGKLVDILSWNVLRLDYVKTLIVDETDMMLDYGFLEEVDGIASKLQNNALFMLYSATIPKGLRAFVKKYLNNPIEIVSEEEVLKPRIEHILVNQRHRNMPEAVLDVLSVINPLLAIVFTNTKVQAVEVANYLRDYGIDCVEIHGDVSDRGRKQVISRINSKKVQYIVATDLAARGIDLPEISHVINAGLPNHDLDFYTHRTGRTGRSGREGFAISIVGPKDQSAVAKLMKQGFSFEYKRIKDGTLEEVRPFYNIQKRTKQLDPEVVQILHRKNVTVKPGYRRKRKMEIESLMQKKRRDMIRNEIREQKKERARARQKEKESI